MKRSNEELAKDILELVKRNIDDMPESEIVSYIENFISWQIDDALKLIKNINETSYNKFDRAQRLIELEQKYGIPKTHLL
jgi:hypothetical protein